MWIYTGNKFAKLYGNILSLSENIAKTFRGATFLDSHCIVHKANARAYLIRKCFVSRDRDLLLRAFVTYSGAHGGVAA